MISEIEESRGRPFQRKGRIRKEEKKSGSASKEKRKNHNNGG